MAAEQQAPGGRPPIAPTTKKRLQKAFEAASQRTGQGQFDYAAQLLHQCVTGDPSNVLYVRSFVENYQKKYNNNKKGASMAQFKELGARASIKKALNDEHWDDVIKHGLKILAVNPWDIPALRTMANAAKHSGDSDCELYYLNCALQANINDPETNRQCAYTMTEREQFDQAIACWARVKKALPDDEEVNRATAELMVKKTIKKGGYEDANKHGLGGGGSSGEGGAKEIPPEERLKRQIAKNPQDLPSYTELVNFYLNQDKFTEAEAAIEQALATIGEDADLRERLFDLQIRRMRAAAAQARDKRKESDAAEQEYRRLRKELNDKEIEGFTVRCERYPNNLKFRFELAQRQQYARDYNEAIKQYQQARNDSRLKGACLLGLGQCFQAIKQNRLAMNHYEQAVAEIPDREAEQKKEALYLAGRMALEETKEVDKADKYLSDLAALDFTFKDVPALLDKIAQIRENGGSPS